MTKQIIPAKHDEEMADGLKAIHIREQKIKLPIHTGDLQSILPQIYDMPAKGSKKASPSHILRITTAKIGTRVKSEDI